MRFIRVLFILILTMLFSQTVSAEENKVTKVIGVDTLEINNQEEVKLYGVSTDIYEKYQKFAEVNDIRTFGMDYKTVGELELYTLTGNEFAEVDAIKEIEKLLLNKSVHLKEMDNNQYLVYFSEEDTYSFNQLILANGYGSLNKNIDSDYKMDFLLEEKNAKDNSFGVWNISFISAGSGSSETTLPGTIYIFLSVFFILNFFIFIFSVKKLSSIPSWSGLLYGLTSLLLIPFPAMVFSLQYELAAKIFLALLFLGIGFIFYYLSIFIIKHKEVLTIPKLLGLIVGAVFIIISFFAIVYSTFDHPRFISVLEQGFTKNQILSDTRVLGGDHIYVNDNKDSFNQYADYIYFSGTTFFGGSYGDVLPKGNIRFIVLIEMLTSFLLQLVFFGIIINIVYEKFTAHRSQTSAAKTADKPEVKQESFEESGLPVENGIASEKKSSNNSTLLTLIVVLLGVLFSKKQDK
ncbi:ion channel [Bacillus sp. P14.5]|uniref:ion channel n=1 Tax=Bacillus sp. P14.5 TaxID=1983400 RepID=UPI000DE9B06E|nr:ion channel [Bacillus sp. P14.5]